MMAELISLSLLLSIYLSHPLSPAFLADATAVAKSKAPAERKLSFSVEHIFITLQQKLQVPSNIPRHKFKEPINGYQCILVQIQNAVLDLVISA